MYESCAFVQYKVRSTPPLNPASWQRGMLQLLDVLDDTQGKQALGELVSQWQGLKALQQASDAYTEVAA